MVKKLHNVIHVPKIILLNKQYNFVIHKIFKEKTTNNKVNNFSKIKITLRFSKNNLLQRNCVIILRTMYCYDKYYKKIYFKIDQLYDYISVAHHYLFEVTTLG